MDTIDENIDRQQLPAPAEPLDVALAAVNRGEASLTIEHQGVTAEIADDDTWSEILEVASAHPWQVTSLVLVADDGEPVRLQRLVIP